MGYGLCRFLMLFHTSFSRLDVIGVTLFASIILYQNTSLAYRLKDGTVCILHC